MGGGQSSSGSWSLLDSQQKVPPSGLATSGVPGRSLVGLLSAVGWNSEPAGGPSPQTALPLFRCGSPTALGGPGLLGPFCFVDDS